MRIAFVHSFYSSKQPSGENFVVRSEIDALKRAGHEVQLFAAHTDQLEGDRLYPLRSAWRVATGRGANPLKAIRNYSPDVVHIHNLFPNFGRKWVYDLEQPLFHTIHNFRPVCANGLLFRDGRICTECPDGRPWASLKHACYRSSRIATAPIAWHNRHGPRVDPLLKRADRIFVLSTRQREIYVRSGLDPRKIKIVPNFLPLDLDPGPPIKRKREGFLFVGRLSEEKGILRLLEVWPHYERLRLVGDGPLRYETENLVRELPEVHLLGSRPRDQVLQLMQRSKALIFPSLWFEGMPLVYLEALACGLPVIAFEPSSIAEWIQKDATGIVSKWGDNLQSALSTFGESFGKSSTELRSFYETKFSENAANVEQRYCLR